MSDVGTARITGITGDAGGTGNTLLDSGSMHKEIAMPQSYESCGHSVQCTCWTCCDCEPFERPDDDRDIPWADGAQRV